MVIQILAQSHKYAQILYVSLRALILLPFQTHLVWPVSARNGEPRTMERTLETLAAMDQLTADEKEGIVGRSPFIDYPDFDFLHGFPAEYLHLVCLGVTKRLIELTFAVGEVRIRITKRKLSSTAIFNEKMRLQLDPSEFGRRGRNLDFSVMKGEELRNVTLFFFPYVLDSIEPSQGKNERKLWLVFAFQVRAYVLPDTEYEHVKNVDLNLCWDLFLVLFEQLYGVRNASYSIHMMCHLKEIRKRGKLTDTSTFAHESYYGEMRRSYVTGTLSTGKQILQNAYLKRSLPHFHCQKPLKFRAKDTTRSSDKLFYVFKNNTYKFYMIKSQMADGSFSAVQYGKRSYKPTEVSLDWSSVGVFLKSGVNETQVIFHPEEITGKAIIVDKLIMSCPTNVLQE